MTHAKPRTDEQIGIRVVRYLTDAETPFTTTELRNRFGSNETQTLKRVLGQLVEAGAITRTEYQPPRGRSGYRYEIVR
jgi:DNA-binding HxlR family transcriptional regulator